MPSLTRSDLVSRIGDLIGDPENTRWTSTQKQNKIQEVQEQFVLDTRVLVDSQTETVVAGTSEYSLPSDVLDIIRVAHRGIRLQRLSKFELDNLYQSDWSDDEGTPHSYYVDLDPNNKKLRLFPVPKAADAGANLVEEWVKIPPTLSSDASVPFDGHTLLVPYHMALAYKAASEFLKVELQNNPNGQGVLATIREYEREYNRLVSHCIETFKHLGETSPMRFRGGRYHKGL